VIVFGSIGSGPHHHQLGEGTFADGGRTMLGLVLGAAILGIIIAVMEGEFPGWVKMIICVLVAVVPAYIINALLPPGLFIIGLAVGTVCAGFAISAVTGMGVQRACIAAGIYLAIQAAISLAFYFMTK
jgi:hypothetical protein